MNAGITAINEEVERASAFVQPLLGEMGKVVVGQKMLVERLIIGLLQGLTLVCLLLVGARFGLGLYYYLGLLGMTLGFAWQHWLMRERERLACLQAFLSNHWAGMLVFIGLALDYALR